MGQPDYNYQQQYPTEQMQVAKKAFVEQPSKDSKFEKLNNAIADTIGHGTFFGIFVLGAFIAVIVIFKKQVKGRFGDFIKIINKAVNGE